MFELRKKGLGAKRIINELGPIKLERYRYDNQGKVVTTSSNRPLSESVVNRYLRDEAVLGSQDEIKMFQGIIDERTFYACQQKIAKGKGGKTTHIKNVLSGIVYCDHCNKKMAFSGEVVSKFGKVRSYIKCNNKAKTNGCDAKNIKYAPLESCLYDLLKHIEDKEEVTVDVKKLQSDIADAIQETNNARNFMIKYPEDTEWSKVYEEKSQIVSDLNVQLSHVKADRSGKLTELELDLTKYEDKAKFNQILKDYDVKAYLGHNAISHEPYLRLIIGAWKDFEVNTIIGKSVNARRVRSGMRLGAKSIDFEARERGQLEFHDPEEFVNEDDALHARLESHAKILERMLTDEQKDFLVRKVKN